MEIEKHILRLIGLLARAGHSLERIKARNDLSDFVTEVLHEHPGTLPNEIVNLALSTLKLSRKSRSQLFQDIWAAHQSGMKTNGYFVEFGAGNGLHLSNTYMLEKEFGWRGVLAEPNPIFHRNLARYRDCKLVRKGIGGRRSDSTLLRCTLDPDYGVLDEFSSLDMHSETMRSQDFYYTEVPVITLCDLLTAADAPRKIDYMSIDTEGNELDIISEFDFNKWDISLITIEHNFSDSRGKIFRILRDFGYDRVYEDISMWDDWYVRTHPSSLDGR